MPAIPTFCRILATALIATPALAQDVVPAAAERAIAAAETRHEPAQRWAFTRTVRVEDAALTARFDPSMPEDNQWTLIDPPQEAALSEEQEDIFEGLRRQPVPDRLIMAGAAGDDYGLRLYVSRDLSPDGGAGRGDYYSFTPREDVGLTFPPLGGPGLPEEAQGEFVLAGEIPSRVRIFAEGPFRPNPAARIDVLDLFWDFGEAEPGGPVVIVRSDTRIQGRALLSSFSTDNSVMNSDFARVSVPPE